MTKLNKISIGRLITLSLLGVTLLMAVTIPYAPISSAGGVACPPAIGAGICVSPMPPPRLKLVEAD